jgi:hypothetical protein
MPVRFVKTNPSTGVNLPPAEGWISRCVDPLAYDSKRKQLRYLAETPFGQALWAFLKRKDVVLSMLVATQLGHPAVEPLSVGLLKEFGPGLEELFHKRLVFSMIDQIMKAVGCKVARKAHRISGIGLFTTGTRYRFEGVKERVKSPTSAERSAWIQETADTPFRRWLSNEMTREEANPQCYNRYKIMDAIAARYGVKLDLCRVHFQDAQLSFEVKLKPHVPPSEYNLEKSG